MGDTALLASVQNKIDVKIFGRLGSTATRKPFSSQSVDEWGDNTPSYDADEAVSVVPYNFLQVMVDFKEYGDLDAGETFMAFKYNQDLTENDLIVYDSKTFIVKIIEKFPMSDGNLVKIARLSEQVN